MEELLKNWPLLSAVIGLTAWLVRLEGKVKRAEDRSSDTSSDLDKLAGKHDQLSSKVVGELAEVRVSLARIEGFLQVKNGSDPHQV